MTVQKELYDCIEFSAYEYFESGIRIVNLLNDDLIFHSG